MVHHRRAPDPTIQTAPLRAALPALRSAAPLAAFLALVALGACNGTTGPNGQNGQDEPFSIVQGDQMSLNVNQTTQLSVRGATGVVEWSSDAPSVVTVVAGIATALAPGQARVTASSEQGSDSIDITVVNRRPVADAGDEQTVRVQDIVTLDGSRSSDEDGQELTYDWRFLERPAGSAASLTDPNVADPSFLADQGGVYHLELVVNDGYDDSAPAQVSVTSLFSDCEVLPRNVDHGTVFTSSGFSHRTVTLTNTGNEPLTLQVGLTGGSSGAYSIVSGAGNVTLNENDAHDVTTRFQPSDDHPRRQTGTVQTGGSVCGTVSLTGTGGVTWTKVTQRMSLHGCPDCHSMGGGAPLLTHSHVSQNLINVGDPASSVFLTYPVSGSMFGGTVVDEWKPGTQTYGLVFAWIEQGGLNN